MFSCALALCGFHCSWINSERNREVLVWCGVKIWVFLKRTAGSVFSPSKPSQFFDVWVWFVPGCHRKPAPKTEKLNRMEKDLPTNFLPLGFHPYLHSMIFYFCSYFWCSFGDFPQCFFILSCFWSWDLSQRGATRSSEGRLKVQGQRHAGSATLLTWKGLMDWWQANIQHTVYAIKSIYL